jgi:hypothetical protein
MGINAKLRRLQAADARTQQALARESLDAATFARISTNPRFGKLCGGFACAKPLRIRNRRSCPG